MGVDPTAVAVEGCGVTRRTSMSDMSEQLAGRPGIRSGLMLAVPSETGCLNQITDEEAVKAAKSSRFQSFTSLFSSHVRIRTSLDLSRVFKLTRLLSNTLF